MRLAFFGITTRFDVIGRGARGVLPDGCSPFISLVGLDPFESWSSNGELPVLLLISSIHREIPYRVRKSTAFVSQLVLDVAGERPVAFLDSGIPYL